MTPRKCKLTTAFVILALLPVPGLAHHSLDEVYLRDSSIELSGTVTSIDWVNPHVVIKLNVQDAQGSIVEWLVEMDPPHGLIERGWATSSIAAGQVITIEGFVSRDDSPRTEAKSITLPDGEMLVASTSSSWNWSRVR